jgi:predicted transcriptional regulator
LSRNLYSIVKVITAANISYAFRETDVELLEERERIRDKDYVSVIEKTDVGTGERGQS